MLTVNDILTERVRILLRDEDAGGIQWTDDELLSWLNEACSEVVRVIPEAHSSTKFHSFAVGPRQAIPAGGTMLLEVLCNATSESALGRVIRRVERHTLDSERPNWYIEQSASEIKRYVPSLTDPRTFHVYPPADGLSGCMLVYASAPEPATDLNDSFALPDVYAALIVNYVCFRAFGKLADDASSQAKSENFLNLFIQGVNASGGVYEQRNAKVRDPVVPQRL